jgi:MOSC domain-containing protein YiiM
MAPLLSVNVGLPWDIAWRGRTVYTSVWKAPVQGRRLVARLNVDGDAQGDLHGHGGEHRAVFVYQMDSYHYWERELKRIDLLLAPPGRSGNRHLKMVRDSRGLKSTWETSEE